MFIYGVQIGSQFIFDSCGWLQINLINNDVPYTRNTYNISYTFAKHDNCMSFFNLIKFLVLCKYISIKNLFNIYVHSLSAICCTNL